jgi:hypothetical protein
MPTGDEGGPDELVIEFTAEELVVLGNALKLTLPLAEPPSLAGDPGVRAALVDLARRSLVARRVLWTDGLEFTVVEPIRKLLEMVSEPGLVVRMGRTDEVARFANLSAYEASPDDPLLLARPDVGVEVRSTSAGNVQLTPFVPTRLLDRVAAATALVDRPVPADVRAFDVAGDAAAATFRLVAAGRADAAVGSLLSERVHEPSARAFVAALARPPVAHSVEINHRPSPAVLAGGVSSWIDGGPAGLWTVPTSEQVEGFDEVYAGPWSAPPSSPRVATISPTSVDGILDELLTYLPERSASPG